MPTIGDLVRARAADDARRAALRGRVVHLARGRRSGCPTGRVPAGERAGRRAVPRRRTARQHPGVLVHAVRGRARRRDRGRHQPDAARRRACPRHRAYRLRVRAHRNRAPRLVRGRGRGRCHPDACTSSTSRSGATRSLRLPARRCPSRHRPSPADAFMLIFTSGTTGAPKAVRMGQERLAAYGSKLAEMFGLGPDDVCYSVMPLFHSNAAVAGFTNVLASGATAVLRRRFSATNFLPDVRRYGVTFFNYVGKPLSYILATPEHDDDAENSLALRVRQRGRAPRCRPVRDAFRLHRRRRLRVDRGRPEHGQDARHAEGFARAPRRAEPRRDPRSRHREGMSARAVRRVGTAAQRRSRDRRDRESRRRLAGSRATTTTPKPMPSVSATACTGPATSATATRTGFFYFAGRSGDWLRVDGENFAATPVELVLARHPDVVLAAVYAVPSVEVGDEVMAALHAAARFRLRSRRLPRVPRRAARRLAQVDAALRAGDRRPAVDRDAEGA